MAHTHTATRMLTDPFDTGPRLAVRLRARLRRLVRNLRDPYRPERHYMRGPGPKWHEKHRND